MTEWNIQSRGHECTVCNKAFVDKETYHTLLFDERTGLTRSDICDGCWQKHYPDGGKDRKGFISYWHGVYEAPPPPSEPIQKENAESLLRKLIALNDPKYIPAGYILAVMLERKRLLKVKEQLKKEGQRVFVYEQPGTGDLFTIIDPDLQLNQLEQVQRDVAQLLEHGIEQPANPEATPPPVAPPDSTGPNPSTPEPVPPIAASTAEENSGPTAPSPEPHARVPQPD